jgi:hypothetical protein
MYIKKKYSIIKKREVWEKGSSLFFMKAEEKLPDGKREKIICQSLDNHFQGVQGNGN